MNGDFSLPDLDAGTYSLRAGAAGYSEVTIADVTVTVGTETVLGNTLLAPLPTSGVLQGQVTDAETGQALAGVAISVTGSSTASAGTATNGVYTLTGLNPGGITITMTLNGYSPVTATATIVAGNTVVFNPTMTPSSPTNVPLPGTSSTGLLRGQVTDADSGAPLANAKVSVDDAATGARLKLEFTGTDGSYEITGLEPGAIDIQIVKSGYLTTSATGTVQAGNALLFSPGLVPETGNAGNVVEEPLPSTPTTGILKGVVTDANTGALLETAKVAVDDAATGQRLKTAFTDAGGSYEITDLEPGDIVIQVSKSGFITATATASAQAGVALVFEPALVPESDDLSSEIEEEPLPETPTTGQLQGVVTDAETGSPLSGATVEVTGSITASTVTAADGTYAVSDITPGEITVTISLTGYLPVSASGSVAAGNAIVFSPSLTPENYVGTDPGRIIERVVEAGSRQPLQHVVVEVSGDLGVQTTSTGTDGGFELNDLPPGDYTVRFESSAYIERALSVVVTSGGTVDMQDVELSLADGTAAVFGQITDADTGAPISEAVVNIMGTVISTQADSDGNYRIEGLEPGNKTLTFSATGYNSQTLIYSLLQPGEFEINRALTLADNTGLDITFLSTDRTSYSAYTAGEIHANVRNNGSPLEAMVVFSMFNEDGELISEFTATRPGEQSTLIMFEPGVIDSVVAPFNSANLPPGHYRIIGRALAGNQMFGPATAILDERTTDLTIDETAVISQLQVDPIPAFSAVGVTETVNLSANIVNRSNVPVKLRFSYDLINPGGAPIKESSTITIRLPPEKDSLSEVIDTFSQTFSESGEHNFDITIRGGPVPDAIETGVLSVAPGLRIDPIQSVTPSVVTPDEDQRVRVNIRLEGKEVQ